MVHVVHVELRNFYKVYVDDDDCIKTTEKIMDEAKQIILNANDLDAFVDDEREYLCDLDEKISLSYGHAIEME